MDISVIVFVGSILGLSALFFFTAWINRHKTTVSTRSAHIAYIILTRFKELYLYDKVKTFENFTDVEYEQAIDEMNQKIPLNEVKSSDVRLRQQHQSYYPSRYTKSSEEGD